MRLIDADHLIKTIEKAQMESLKVNVLSLIYDAPTIEERPKGKWIEHVDEKWGGVWYTCSNCYQDALYEQDVYNIWRQKLSDICPICGARMEDAQ